MGLQKIIPVQNTGLIISYANVKHIQIDYALRRAIITIQCFKDRDAKEAGADPAVHAVVVREGDDFEKSFGSGQKMEFTDPRELAYVETKKDAFWADAIDVVEAAAIER